MPCEPWEPSGRCSTSARKATDTRVGYGAEDMSAQGKVRILQVEDNVLDAELVLSELELDGIDFETRLVDDEQAYLECLERSVRDYLHALR